MRSTNSVLQLKKYRLTSIATQTWLQGCCPWTLDVCLKTLASCRSTRQVCWTKSYTTHEVLTIMIYGTLFVSKTHALMKYSIMVRTCLPYFHQVWRPCHVEACNEQRTHRNLEISNHRLMNCSMDLPQEYFHRDPSLIGMLSLVARVLTANLTITDGSETTAANHISSPFLPTWRQFLAFHQDAGIPDPQ